VPLGRYFHQIPHNFQKADAPADSGELALAFTDLIQQLWAAGDQAVDARRFKVCLAAHRLAYCQVLQEAMLRFAPRYSGGQEQDTADFWLTLQQGLHQALNRARPQAPDEAVDYAGNTEKVHK